MLHITLKAIAGTFITVLLWGCSIGSPSVSPFYRETAGVVELRIPSLPQRVAITDAFDGNDDVAILNRLYKLQDTIHQGIKSPDGDWYDANGNLYVASYGNATVQEYAKSSSSPAFTYKSGLHDPVDVTTDVQGNVYVAEYNPAGMGAGVVDEYSQGVNKVKRRCSPGGLVEGVAVDASSDVFVSQLQYSFADIVEYKGGLKGCNRTYLPVTLSSAGGLQVDKKKRLVVVDQKTGVDIIKPPYRIFWRQIGGFSQPFHDALNSAQDLLYVTDPGAGTTDVFTYPGGTLKARITAGIKDPYGVAVYQR